VISFALGAVVYPENQISVGGQVSEWQSSGNKRLTPTLVWWLADCGHIVEW
jgi:hypothetical protein